MFLQGYAKDLEKLSDGIADLDADFKLLFHMIWVLYGLVFAVILKIPGTVGDVDGKTSDLEARFLAAVKQSNCIKRDQASLEVEVIKRNAKKVSEFSLNNCKLELIIRSNGQTFCLFNSVLQVSSQPTTP